MLTHASALTVCGVVVALLGTVASVNARSNAGRLTYLLTFNRAVALPGVTLEAGTYAFDVPNADSIADVVRVRNRDRTQVYFVGLTQTIARPAGLRRDCPVLFGPARPDDPTPIVAWFPSEDETGYQFLYQK